MSSDGNGQHTRTEQDLLGQRAIPADAYWGVHTLRAMENFQLSTQRINDVPELIRGMVMVKKAAALANRDLGALRPEVAAAIVAACELVLEEGQCMQQFPIDVVQGGAGTSLNMNVNEVIANLALEQLGLAKGRYDVINPNDDVNKSQSTNDAYPTGLRLALHEALDGLKEAISRLVAALAAKGSEFSGVLKMGRTQLQDAVPMTLGQEFNAFASLLAEEIEHLARSQELLVEINLGATAIGTGLNTPPGYVDDVTAHLADVSGLPLRSAADFIEATADTGVFVAAHSAMKRAAIKLSKICNDLRLLASGPRAGLGEINLPESRPVPRSCRPRSTQSSPRPPIRCASR